MIQTLQNTNNVASCDSFAVAVGEPRNHSKRGKTIPFQSRSGIIFQQLLISN